MTTPSSKIICSCQHLSVMPNLTDMFWEVCLTKFSFFPFEVQIASCLYKRKSTLFVEEWTSYSFEHIEEKVST